MKAPLPSAVPCPAPAHTGKTKMTTTHTARPIDRLFHITPLPLCPHGLFSDRDINLSLSNTLEFSTMLLFRTKKPKGEKLQVTNTIFFHSTTCVRPRTDTYIFLYTSVHIHTCRFIYSEIKKKIREGNDQSRIDQVKLSTPLYSTVS